MSISRMECTKLLRDICDSSELTGDELMYFCRQTLEKRGISLTWEKETPDMRGRVILHINRYYHNTSKLSRECNGIILERGTWNVIAYPAPPIFINYNVKRLSASGNQTKYKIYAADDGTTCIMYHWNGQWRLSTNRAYDATDMKQYGTSISYMDALRESMAEVGVHSLDHLNTAYSYVVGFHHVKCHPFGNTNRAWLTEIYDKDGNVVEEDIGLPRQRQENISIQSALKTARAALKTFIDSNPQSKHRRAANFGYIVSCGTHRVLIESTLMDYIRHTFYSNRVISVCKENPYINKTQYVVLRNITESNDPTFRRVFTNLAPLSYDIESKVNAIYDNAICYVKGKKMPNDNSIEITNAMMDELQKRISIKTLRLHNNILWDYLVSSNMTMPLYRFIFAED